MLAREDVFAVQRDLRCPGKQKTCRNIAANIEKPLSFLLMIMT